MHVSAKLAPMSRRVEMEQFVAEAGYAGAPIALLAGDASFRKYWRVQVPDGTLVLMDAPPEHEDVAPFMRVTAMLRAMGLCAPAIHAHDTVRGFLLLEDLGDNLFSKALAGNGSAEAGMYQAACEALVHMHVQSRNNVAQIAELAVYDASVYLREVALFAEWFLVQVHGQSIAADLRDEWLAIWRGVLAGAGLVQEVLVHRDYHADNLLWHEGKGIARVGMLDYQDALFGDPLYDVISLLEDARRDVSAATVEACKTALQRSDQHDAESFARRYHVLAAQRNCKIIGIFTRLCVRDGKSRYLEYMPRVWGHLLGDMTHPVLAPVKAFIDTHVPAAYRSVFQADTARGGLIQL